MNHIQLKQSLEAFFLEDMGEGDITSEWICAADDVRKAELIVKAEGVIAGLPIIQHGYCLLDPDISVTYHVHDGDTVQTGDKIATVRGPIRQLLSGERVLMNLLQRMSGIATYTMRAVAALDDARIRICDTRKTTPGLRMLEKYAVRCGGGVNHRFGLSDGVLIKDNHIAGAGSIAAAVAGVKEKAGPMVKIEVEVETKDELLEAVEAGADLIMFDNRSPEEIKAWLPLVPDSVLTEVSGNVDLSTIHTYRDCGVDFISSGALTHSAPVLDMSLNVEGGKKYESVRSRQATF